MNILTIGLGQNSIDLFDMLAPGHTNRVIHLFDRDQALLTIKDVRFFWDWVILQGHDNPEHWKSILCAINASARDTAITVLSSHIDGTRLNTPVCSMHNDDNNQLTVSRCAMQSLLQQDGASTRVKPRQPEHIREETPAPTPIVFEYHAPCR